MDYWERKDDNNEREHDKASLFAGKTMTACEVASMYRWSLFDMCNDQYCSKVGL